MTENLKVTYIQTDLHWEAIGANLAMFEEKIWKIGTQTDLIVLPEMFSTGFSMNPKSLAEPMNSTTFRWMKQQAAQTGAVLMGSCIISEQGKYFNRLLAIYPDGQFQYYDKRHLFGLAGEGKDYTSGKKRLTINVKGWRIFPQICYDLRFPVWARSQSSEENLYEYDVLVYIASWPVARVHAWDVLLQARAIENLSYCIGVNRIGKDGGGFQYPGHSAVIDYLGHPYNVPGNEDEIFTQELSASNLSQFRDRFPFQKDADRMAIL